VSTVVFVRHAATVGGAGDPGLSADGRRQAEQLGERLAGTRFDGLYSSPLRRACETADILGQRLGLEPVIDTRLRERTNWGDVPGQPYEEFTELWRHCDQDRDYVPEGGMSSRQAGRMLDGFVREVHGNYPSDTVLAVTHGGIIADFLLNHYSEDELSAALPDFRHLAYAGMVSIAFDGDRPAVVGTRHTSTGGGA
jgi:broad specificity phosphatase PhoE